MDTLKAWLLLINTGCWLLSPWVFIGARYTGFYNFQHDSAIFLVLLLASLVTSYLVFDK